MAPGTRNAAKNRSNAAETSGDAPAGEPARTEEVCKVGREGKGASGSAAPGGKEVEAAEVEGVVTDVHTDSDDDDGTGPDGREDTMQ